MTRAPQRAPVLAVPIELQAERAAQALQQQRFKEAADLYKTLLKQQARPEWRQALGDAYRGRARTLAAKQMFKEAAIVLENTLAANGTLPQPLFYLQCLLRDGQLARAAEHAVRYLGIADAVAADERATFEELTAALLVATPTAVTPRAGEPAERSRWLTLAAATRAALAAWRDGADADTLAPLLQRISLRSPFRPVRLLLQALTSPPDGGERARRLLDSIPPGSPFAALREAVAATLPGGPPLDAAGWQRLSRLQRAFVAETSGLPPWASQFLTRAAEAADSGPAALFGFLLKQTELPPAERRSACLNLLPAIPDRLAQFEKAFGALAAPERHRIQALAAEARGDWQRAELCWRDAADALLPAAPADAAGRQQAGLARGVIFRHLSRLAEQHGEIGAAEDFDDPFDDAVIFYLERACEADPEDIAGLLALLGRYRTAQRLHDWHRLVDEAARRFPGNAAVLAQAIDAATARKSYKKAAGFARKLLRIDPINPGVRRKMIESQLAHARKQMRAGRADLAARELAAAAEWERAGAPSATLRIAQAVLGLGSGQKDSALSRDAAEAAQARLREAVALAGGGVAGWFRAALEAELMHPAGADLRPIRAALVEARQTPPTPASVMAVVAALGQREAVENKRAVAPLLLGLRPWLLQAAEIAWPVAEFEALSETLVRFEAFDLLAEFARAARGREPGNPIWRFHDILARSRGDSARLSMADGEALLQLIEAAVARQDLREATRIERFLYGDARDRPRRRRAATGPADDLPDEAIIEMITAMLGSMPKRTADSLRDLVRERGREPAIAQLIEEFQAAPPVPGMSAGSVRMLCEAMIEQAISDTGRRAGGRRR